MPVPVSPAAAPPISPRQLKPLVRWLAVLTALAGWYFSLQLLGVSLGAKGANPLLQVLCGGAEENDCTAVLTGPRAFVPLGREPGSLRVPTATLGLVYFGFVALWYVFVGTPAGRGRAWHALILVIVVVGCGHSLRYIGLMAWELQRWCAGCLLVHGLNGALLVLTLWAYPWRGGPRNASTHPTARLALATTTAGVLAGVAQFALVLAFLLGNILKGTAGQYERLLTDPDYVLWDYRRQAPVDLPPADDDLLAGPAAAPHVLVVFSDYQCAACRAAHQLIERLRQRHPDRLRVAYKHYPQDTTCNPHPAWRGAGHAAACQAARAVEAACLLGGTDAGLRMQALLYERQQRMPATYGPKQMQRLREMLVDWAAEIGLERAAFSAALDHPTVSQRLQADIEWGRRLGLQAVPVLYLDGRRVNGWSKLETWDALLAEPPGPAPAGQ